MKNVLIYSTPICHFCELAKEFFKENNIQYTEYDVASDQDKRAEMIKKTGQLGVPVIEIGNEIIVGFNEVKLRSMLGL